MMIAAASLLGACGTDSPSGDTDSGSGAPVSLMFHVERDLLQGFEHDTGFVPEAGPASIRARASATAALVVDAEGLADATELTPVEGSGLLQVEAGLSLELSARVDTSGIEWEGVVDTFEYGIEPAEAAFEPFLLGESVSVSSPLPASEIARVPVGAIPGATLIASIEGGAVDTSFSGVCATVADGVAQYTGTSTIEGTVDLAATLEIDVPLLGTESFGPFSFPVPIPASTMALDLGSFTVADGTPVDASPCAGETGTSGVPGSGSGTEEGGDTEGGADTGETVSDDSGDSTDMPGLCEETCGGCCLDGECLDGFEPAACGSSGACQVCDAGEICDGVSCVAEPDCLATCEGCCMDGVCLDGFAPDACGFQEECEDCGADSTCNGLDCVPAQTECLDTCAGCCVGGECNLGSSDEACGSFGACEDCGANGVCVNDTCVAATWTITLLSGEILVGGLDAFDGPDPYLELSSMGPGLAFSQSETASNTSEPVWNDVLGESVALTNPFVLEMWDEDSLTADDLIGACTVSFPASAFGGTHEVECEVDGELAWTALFAIDPA